MGDGVSMGKDAYGFGKEGIGLGSEGWDDLHVNEGWDL